MEKMCFREFFCPVVRSPSGHRDSPGGRRLSLGYRGAAMSAIPTAVDVVVAGSGATGLAAALTLAEGGASVAVFEKQRALGRHLELLPRHVRRRERDAAGALHRLQPGRRLQEHHGVQPLEGERPAGEGHSRRIGGDHRLAEGPRREFTGPDDQHARRPVHLSRRQGHGRSVIKALATQAKSKGVQILPGTPVVALIKEGGRVTGVVVDEDGEEVDVAARAVIIATGGYANNKEWIKKYTGYDLDVNLFAWGTPARWATASAWPGRRGGRRGYGVAGVVPGGADGRRVRHGCNDLEVVAMQPDLWVTPAARDSATRASPSTTRLRQRERALQQRRLHLQPVRRFDHRAPARERGSTGAEPRCSSGVQAGERAEGDAGGDRAGSTEVFAADSLEELPRYGHGPGRRFAARSTSTTPSAPRDTTTCSPNRQSSCGRWLGPRYYAVKARTAFLGTMGGIRINEHLEVLDKKRRAIPGLYAGGFDAGGMYGDSYPIRVSSGLSSAFALNSGRIAGRSALRYLGL